MKPNHRLNRGELEILFALTDYEQGNAMASKPPDKKYARKLERLKAKLRRQHKLLD